MHGEYHSRIIIKIVEYGYKQQAKILKYQSSRLLQFNCNFQVITTNRFHYEHEDISHQIPHPFIEWII